MKVEFDTKFVKQMYWTERLGSDHPISAVNDIIELRDLCVLLFDAVKHGNQVTDLPGLWNKAEEVLKRTDPEKNQ